MYKSRAYIYKSVKMAFLKHLDVKYKNKSLLFLFGKQYYFGNTAIVINILKIHLKFSLAAVYKAFKKVYKREKHMSREN